ncbi:MAG TPA: serine/threonine-protein kinase [Terriglobales bacterium]|nr:serine/threonine-protein kinase [Terriglobales bacterium]
MLAPGTRLGPYVIAGPLGAGGMGEVYRAHDSRLQREVAIKVLPAALAHDPEALRRLEQEARAVAALNHPNLLTVHDVGTTPEGSPFLVCELLEGETLREALASGPVAQRRAVDYAVQIARGLAAAHEKGIVHRDLKPANIFITKDGRIKILDFGLAKLIERAASDERTVAVGLAVGDTAPGMVLGTAAYMSPEQARGQAADQRSDIFSFGAVFYEMLSGQRAFRGDTAADIISSILREEPPELATTKTAGSAITSPALERALDRIIRHCLEKSPQLRFQSAGDIAFSLADLSQATTGSEWAQTGPDAVSFFTPRRIGFSAVGLSGLLLAVVATWMLAANRAPSAPAFRRLTYEQGIINRARFAGDSQDVMGSGRWNEAAANTLFSVRADLTGLQELPVRPAQILAMGHEQVAVLYDLHGLGGYSLYGTLAVMPPSGGQPRPMLDSVQFADFAPAGDLAITRFHPDSSTFTLEYPVGTVLYRNGGWIGDPRFSRDGKSIAFIDHPNLGDDLGRIAVVALASRKKLDLTPLYATAQGLAWSPSGREIWFTASNTIDRTLRAVTLSGKVRSLYESAGNLTIQDTLADGRVLLTATSQRQYLKVVTAQQPRPHEMSVLDWPQTAAISGDGRQLLVGDEDAGTHYSTYLRPIGAPAGSDAPIRLGDGDPIALSPDGKWAVSVVPSTPAQLLLLPTGTGNPMPVVSNIDFSNSQFGAWLPDSSAFLASGNEPGHPLRTFRVGVNGAVAPLTSEGVIAILYTPDGKALVERKLGVPGYFIAPIVGGPPQAIVGLQAREIPIRFSADGKSLFVSRAPATETQDMVDLTSQLWRITLASGQRTLLASATPDGVAGSNAARILSVSGDGTVFAYLYGQSLSTLYLVTGLR